MSGMTMGEKLLARACGRDRVRPGEIVHPDPKLVILHDGFVVPARRELDALGVTAPLHPERVVFVTDHEVAYATPAAAARGARIRQTARDWRIGHFFDVGRGGHGHLFPMETGLVRPGDVLFAYDMHCQNFGAIGALALRAGSEVIAVLATGTLWQEVPRSVRVTLRGAMRTGVMARDAGFRLAADLVAGAAPYDWRVIEFGGTAADLPLAERVGLINTLTEIGVANVLFPPLDPLIGVPPPDAVLADADASYEAALDFDLGALTPQLARPGAPENAVAIETALGTPVQHAVLGACGSGLFDDFAAAARAMAGRPVAPGVRLFVAPGTAATARRMAVEGLTAFFAEAGAILLPMGCGPCAGGVMAPLLPGETSIATAATNHAGRMGAKDAAIWLGSPATVGASAAAGAIADPRAT